MIEHFFHAKLERAGLIILVGLATVGLGCTSILVFAPEHFLALDTSKVLLASLAITAPGFLFLLLVVNVLINLTSPVHDDEKRLEDNYGATFTGAVILNAIALGIPTLIKVAFDFGTVTSAIWIAIAVYLAIPSLAIIGFFRTSHAPHL